MALEGRKGHLLTETLELSLRGSDLLAMRLVLSLNDMRILQLLKLLVEFLHLGWIGGMLHLLMRYSSLR